MFLILKKKSSISIFIFLLLIFLAYIKQGSIYYKILIISIFIFNFLLIDLKKVKSFIIKFFKKDINIIFLISLIIFFSRNLYSFQILISSILAFFLYFNFRELEKKIKIRIVYFCSIFSVINYYILGFLLSSYFKSNYLLNYDVISNLNDYNFFVGINFHNISILFLGILFLKCMYFRICLKEFRNIYVISIIHDLLFILNLGYISVIIFSLLLSTIYFLLRIAKTKRDKILFFLTILFSLNFILLPFLTNKLIQLNLILPFEKINMVLEFIEFKLSGFDGDNYQLVGLQEIKSSLGNDFIHLLGLINRIIYYWSPIFYEINIFGINNYNDFIYHSLFLEFLSNFGLIGLFGLYFYILKFYSYIDTKYSKLFFLIIICLNTMDTFLFSHHYQLMIMSWVFIGLLDEKKKIIS